MRTSPGIVARTKASIDRVPAKRAQGLIAFPGPGGAKRRRVIRGPAIIREAALCIVSPKDMVASRNSLLGRGSSLARGARSSGTRGVAVRVPALAALGRNDG